jgi:hypothetical protein
VLKNSVDFYNLLIGAEGSKTPVGVRFRGDPAGASAEEARRNAHGKRRAWSGNQQAILTEPSNKKKDKPLWLSSQKGGILESFIF